MVDRLVILNLNVKGLRDPQKRRKVFALLRDFKGDIITLQETHATQETQMLWQSEWGGIIRYANGDSKARGVMTLFRKNLNCSIENSYVDSSGRVLILEVKIDQNLIVITNIYAPNEDDVNFYQNTIQQIENFDNRNIIWSGDFNLVMNPAIDRYNSTSNHKKACAVLESYMLEAELVDIWRLKNPQARSYTWQNNDRKSRIDMFVINEGFIPMVQNVTILACNLSDHALLSLSIDLTDQPRGPGLWKLV